MTVVVTGAGSFIGQQLITKLEANGQKVTGLDQAPGPWQQADIRADSLAEHIPDGSDCLVHLAAISSDPACAADPAAAISVNIDGTANILAAAKTKNVRQVVFASTEWVYGQGAEADVFSEDRPIQIGELSSLYAFTKATAERLLDLLNDEDGPVITILRFGIVYGARTSGGSAVESVFSKLRKDGAAQVGSLKTARRFIHVDDIADGICAALETNVPGTFNLAGADLISLGDIVQASEVVLGRTLDVTESAPDNISIRNPVIEKYHAATGFVPHTTLLQGLQKLAAAFDEGAPS